MNHPHHRYVLITGTLKVEWAEADPFKAMGEVPMDPVVFWSGVRDYKVGGR